MIKYNQGNRLLYFSAPSRGGSSLLETILNSLKHIIIINEPPNSHRIDKREIIDSVFNSILKDLREGFIMQRLGKEGNEVTDTFPNENISWQKQKVDFYQNSIVGIKKSFPSLGNKDYHDVFIREWKSFVKWFVKDRNGKVLAIIRNPIYTIFSWKTTFDALRADTTRQCKAWNRIVSAILETSNDIHILRYEDLINDVNKKAREITDFLGVKFAKVKDFPKIQRSHNALDYYVKNRKLTANDIEQDFMVIVDLCSSIACELGYNLDKDRESLTKVPVKK